MDRFVTFNQAGIVDMASRLPFSAGAVAVPDELSAVPTDRLGLVSGVIVDMQTLGSFFVDRNGRKYPARADVSWSQVSCSWSDKLVRDGDAWRAHVPSDDLLDYAASTRWQTMNSGITVQGLQVSTTDESRGLVQGAYLRVQNGATSCRFKSDTGWVTLSADQVTAIAVAVGNFVQSCFDLESSLDGQIRLGQIVSKDQIATAFSQVNRSF